MIDGNDVDKYEGKILIDNNKDITKLTTNADNNNKKKKKKRKRKNHQL